MDGGRDSLPIMEFSSARGHPRRPGADRADPVPGDDLAGAGGGGTCGPGGVGSRDRSMDRARLDAVDAVAHRPTRRRRVRGCSRWTGRRCARPATAPARLTGHTDVMYTLAFTDDARTLAAGSTDGTTSLWDVTNPRRPHRLGLVPAGTKPDDAPDPVDSVAFDPAGAILAPAAVPAAPRCGMSVTPRRRNGVTHSPPDRTAPSARSCSPRQAAS